MRVCTGGRVKRGEEAVTQGSVMEGLQRCVFDSLYN